MHMSLHKEFYLMLSCVFLCVCFFAWLADRIWKISGRKTYSLINMALGTPPTTGLLFVGDLGRFPSINLIGLHIRHS